MKRDDVRLPGLVISPGAAFGYAIVGRPLAPLGQEAPPLALESVESEVDRLEQAVLEVRANLEEHVRQFHTPHDNDVQDILAAHMLMLDDQRFFEEIIERIRGDQLPAEFAVERTFSALAERLVMRGDRYLQARAEEVRDLSQNIRRALAAPDDSSTAASVRLPAVVLSPSLGITEALRARRLNTAAFVTSSTALTSHGAILLRAIGIPALGGVDLVSEPVDMGDPVLVDAMGGALIINPSEERKNAILRRPSSGLRSEADRSQPPLTIRLDDGSKARLLGNIDHPSQAGLCLDQRLSGIGLFRTEFMVLDAGRVPGEEEQVGVYRAVLEQLGNRPVMIRTFDLGGDKTVAGLHQCTGPNPALGVRGLRRHILRFPEEMKTQLRAILRAAEGHTVTILLPMVTDSGDLILARDLLREAKDDLAVCGEKFSDRVRVAAMIEVPSAAINIADLLPLVDAVSIGTNDLIQYLTASDRDNEAVVHYQQVQASGLEYLLQHIVDAVRAEHRLGDLAVCGEFASTTEGARLLVQLGIRSLSVFPSAAPVVREALGTPLSS